MKWAKRIVPLWLVTLFSCGSEPLPTVNGLELKQYMGTWYEIARFPHRFEKELQCVSATYTLLDNGKVKVYNRGYHVKKQEYKDITGRAWVPDENFPGQIKVSFFRPFAGDYYVIDLAPDYSSALVGAPSRNYLWILARGKDLDPERYAEMVARAEGLGFDVSRLEMVKHDCE